MAEKKKGIEAVVSNPIGLPEGQLITGGRYRQLDNPVTFLHKHECLELGYCHEGGGIFIVEDKILPYKAGDVCVIGDEAHLASSIRGTSSQWTFLYFDPVAEIGDIVGDQCTGWRNLRGRDFLNIISPVKQPRICRLIESLADEFNEKRQGYENVCKGLLVAIMAVLDRISAGIKNSAPASPRFLDKVAPAVDYLGKHYCEEVSSDELALRCHLSPTHFRRIFSAAMGCSPRTYQMRLRIETSKCLLNNNDLLILDISHTVGFQTLSSFNRQFKALTGYSPREWKRVRM